MPKETKLKVSIVGEDKTKKAVESAKTRVGSLTKVVKSYYAEMATVAGAVYGAVKVVKDLTNAYGVQQQSIAKLNAALKSTGIYTPTLSKELQNLASRLQGVTTYGDEATLQAAALLQSLGNLNAEGLKQAIPLVQDLAAGLGIDLETAASLVGKTLGSSTNALSRYGIVLDATAEPSEKLAQLTEEVNNKFGGMASAIAGTYLGRVEQLRNAFGDIKEQLGEQLIPVLMTFIGWIQKAINWYTNLDDRHKKLINTLTLLAGGIAALTPVVIALSAAFTALSGPIGIIIAALAGLTAATILVVKNWKEIKEKIIEIWTGIKDFIKNIVANIINAIREHLVDRFFGVVDKIREGVDKIKGFFADLADKLVGHSIIPDMVDKIEASFEEMKDIMVIKSEEAVNKTKSMFETLVDYMLGPFTTSFSDAWDAIWYQTGDTSKKIKEALKELIISTLRGLAKQYAAMAAVFAITLQWGKAARYAAAAAGLLTVAQAVSKLQQGGIVRAQQGYGVYGGYGGGDVVPAMLEPGEMVIRKEVVERNRPTLEAMNSGEGMPLQVNVYLGSKLIYSEIQKAIQNRQILVSAGSVV